MLLGSHQKKHFTDIICPNVNLDKFVLGSLPF
jgi:hypothetical protein